MAKRMRKMMAMLMALSLCFSTIVLPVVAEETALLKSEQIAFDPTGSPVAM